MKVLFEDKFFMIIEKPADMLSEPTEGENSAVAEAEKLCGGKCFPVHRLDRGTGGAMLVAKTSAAAGKLSAMIQGRELEKEYLAVVSGVPAEESGVFEDLLFRDAAKNKSFIVDRPRKGVKEAKLTYRLLASAETERGAASLVLVRLYTGRTHQIRVQFAGRKLPLLGDGKYGSRDNRCGPALWSCRLAFLHPFTGKTVEARSFPPKEYPWDMFPTENIGLDDIK